jgi:hypothetical protein
MPRLINMILPYVLYLYFKTDTYLMCGEKWARDFLTMAQINDDGSKILPLHFNSNTLQVAQFFVKKNFRCKKITNQE